MKETSLTLKLINVVLIFLDLILVLLDIFLNPQCNPTTRGTALPFLGYVLMIIEVRGRDKIAFVVVLSLDAGSVHLNGLACVYCFELFIVSRVYLLLAGFIYYWVGLYITEPFCN
jgi:hypothetical protein